MAGEMLTFDAAVPVLTGKLIALYGFTEGRRIAAAAAEPVLRDFRQMVRSAAPGTEVSEEYFTEDRKAKILLKGGLTDNRRARVTEITVTPQ